MKRDSTVASRGPLVVRGGMLRVLGAAAGIEVGRDGCTVGRHKSCDLVLEDGRVSSIHAELVATPEGVRIRDRGSRNGVVASGLRIVEALLTGPCRLVVGETTLVFEPTEAARVAVPLVDGVGHLIGRSAVMRAVFDSIARVAPTDLTVLVLGETGTGKEVVAREIHAASKRRRGPFVVVDCASIPPSLAEATLFGHERGAFTGAVSKRTSPFADARGGTIFLDELGELPPDIQPRLLRVLAERSMKPVGGSAYEDIDVRVVAATRRDLVREVNAGAFRSDLYFRAAQFRIDLPPLRDRKEDIPILVSGMLREIGGDDAPARVPSASIDRLFRHDFPGNVRELRNAVTVAHALSAGGAIDVAAALGDATSLPREATSYADSGGYHAAKAKTLERFEGEYFRWLAAASGGKIREMAALADLERSHVRRYLKRHGLHSGRTRKPSAAAAAVATIDDEDGDDSP